ncbi:MAG: helix-turn-helix domain-containing protein [Spongiibacteraceae bacterium]
MTSKTHKKTSTTGSKNSLEDYPKGARKLILTAERLFGQHGFDNVSLRQIVTASGQANNYAVQHHFGSKEGLIEAIFTIRMAVLDAARGEFLNVMKKSGELTTENIIKAIMMPILEAFDEKERHLYADFMFHLFHRDKIHANSIISGDVPEYANFAPAVNELNTLLRKQLAHLPAGVFNTRYRLAAELFLSGLNERKRISHNKGNSYTNLEVFWKDMLKLSVVIFTTPYP